MPQIAIRSISSSVITSPVRSWSLVVRELSCAGHGLGVLQSTAGLQVSHNHGGTKRVTSDPGLHAEPRRAPACLKVAGRAPPPGICVKCTPPVNYIEPYTIVTHINCEADRVGLGWSTKAAARIFGIPLLFWLLGFPLVGI
jgi:hypothetical protein